MRRNSEVRRADAYTLVELLITIGLVGLLVALLLPAIGAARETSRRASCAIQLRQLGAAVASYGMSYGVFPHTIGTPNGHNLSSPNHYDTKLYSVYPSLLPDLDSAALYHAVNFDVALTDPFEPVGGLDHERGAQANRTAMGVRLAFLLCPSDPGGRRSAWTGPTNYRANIGNTRVTTRTNGPFSNYIWSVTQAEITDGLSQTALFSEKLRGDVPVVDFNPRRHMMLVVDASSRMTDDEAIANCRRTGQGMPFQSHAGLSWFVGGHAHTTYTHVLEPNSTLPDCVPPGYSPPPGVIAARSNHPGGVNMALADGSVRFVTNSVDRSIWRALGSRAGGETIASADY